VYRHTFNVCIDATAATAMDAYDGPRPSSGEEDCNCDSSLQTRPLTPPVRDPGTGSDSRPPRSADIPPDTASRPFQSSEPPYYDWRTLRTAQEQAIQRWELPRRPEYGTLAGRVATFFQKEAPWNPEGKPSVGSLAAAGFYYVGGFTFNIIKC
jgi:hypothetical protein